jgi:alpha-tubulin suppressor-like RCC1 family protein
VACGYGFSIFTVKTEDKIGLFGTGINTDSQIGYHKHGGRTNRPLEILIAPVPIELPLKPNETGIVRKVGAGRAHTVVLMEDGTIFTLGNNSYGQCGRKIVDNENYLGSQLIHRLDKKLFEKPVKNVVCGQDHSLFITEEGSVYGCGWSADGQTGLGHYENTDCPSRVNGEIQGEKIVKIASVGDCTLALNDRGEVFGWGNSEYGQVANDGQQQINVPVHLKFTRDLGKIVDVAAGGSFCLVLNGEYF